MSFTVSEIDAPAGRITFPRRGIWTAVISLSTENPPALTTRVKIVAGGLTLSGTITRRGVLASSSEVEIIGGAAGWRKPCPAPPLGGHRADNLVRLSEVCGDLAAGVGERVVLEPGAERGLGYAWARAAGLAATALEEATRGAWWMDLVGVTHVGERPAPRQITAPWTVVPPFSPATGSLIFTAQADDLGAFLVGDQLVAPDIGTFTIGALELRWAASTIRLTAWRL